MANAPQQATIDAASADWPFLIRVYTSAEAAGHAARLKKRKRSLGMAVVPTPSSVLYQKSICPLEGKVKSGRSFDSHHTVFPLQQWTEAKSYIRLNERSYTSGQFVYVANPATVETQRTAGARNPTDEWVAKILEIRAVGMRHVFARVAWMYWPQDLPKTANTMDIIHAMSVTEHAKVDQWVESERDGLLDALYWRQGFDTTELSVIEGSFRNTLELCTCALSPHLLSLSSSRQHLIQTMTAQLHDVGQTPLAFLLEARGLKQTKRTGWLRFIDDAESVADHTFRVALLAFVAPPKLDPLRCMQMAVIHDLAESVVGDIPLYAMVPKEEKHKLEKLAIGYLQSLLSCNPQAANQLMTLWLEYESGASPEAAYVKSADKLECLIQAYEYEEQTFGEVPGLEEFQGLNSKCAAPAISSWAQALRELREEHIRRRGLHRDFVFVIGQTDGVLNGIQRIASKSRFEVVDFSVLVRAMSTDNQHPYSRVLREYMAADCTLPSRLCVSLLEARVNTGSRFLILGFPVASLEDFERSVQRRIYTIQISQLDVIANSQYGFAQNLEYSLARLQRHPARHYKVAVDESDFEAVFAGIVQQVDKSLVPSENSGSNTEWSIESVLTQLGIEAPVSDSLPDFYALASRLKKIKRAGWLRYGIDAESIADHSCLMSFLTFALPSEVSSEKCTRMCLIHDLAEVLVGDVTPFSGVPKEEKMRREHATFQYLIENWPTFGASIRDLWLEFEEGASVESQYARDLDKMEMMLQAFEYEKQYKMDLGEFFGAARKLTTSWGRSQAGNLLQKRKNWRASNPQSHLTTISSVTQEDVRKLQDDYYD